MSEIILCRFCDQDIALGQATMKFNHTYHKECWKDYEDDLKKTLAEIDAQNLKQIADNIQKDVTRQLV